MRAALFRSSKYIIIFRWIMYRHKYKKLIIRQSQWKNITWAAWTCEQCSKKKNVPKSSWWTCFRIGVERILASFKVTTMETWFLFLVFLSKVLQNSGVTKREFSTCLRGSGYKFRKRCGYHSPFFLLMFQCLDTNLLQHETSAPYMLTR